MPNARRAQEADLEPLLALFRRSEASPALQPIELARQIWSRMLAQDGLSVFVSDLHPELAATCMLITAPNLLRVGRAHGFLENVVTRDDLRGQGHGRAVVEAALAQAWAQDCHHVLLQSGRRDPRVHRFYERCGFRPGIRVGYVAERPSGLIGR